MRVITGIAKGRRLETPDGYDVRPTSDRVKEAIFSSIQFDIEGRQILDLFAGSGQLGIEALSRGAESAVFVDADKNSLAVTEKNVKLTGFEKQSKLVRSDCFSFLASNFNKFDIAFLDPPYKAGILEKVLIKTSENMSDYGIIVCEHPTDVVLPQNVGKFVVVKSTKYGKIMVTVYRIAGETVGE